MSMNREQSFAIPTKEEWMAALTMRHGEERQKAFSAATVAVCGLGGLGSNIATALARAGIGKLILMDFDCVDITNLHRQQYKITQIGMPKTEAMVQNLLSHIRPGMIDPRKYTIHLQVIPRNGIHASCTLPFFLLYVLHHQLFIHTDFAHALLQ